MCIRDSIIIVRQGDYNNKGGDDGSSDLFQYIAEGYKIATSIE